MKNPLVHFSLAAVLLAGCGAGDVTTHSPTPQPQDPFPVLNGYGNWIEIAGYGRVWQPAVTGDWSPFVDGQWIWTDRGWMWDSDEPYGWVVYHYGSWTRFGAAGWVWVPGYEWSPARVRWYVADRYVGWAPLPPPRAEFPDAYEPGGDRYWVVVPTEHFAQTGVSRFRTQTALPALPPAGRTGSREKSPDPREIERSGTLQLRERRTEKENVVHGQRTLTRIRITSDNVVQPVQAAPPLPAPATTEQPAPVLPAAAAQPAPPKHVPPAAPPGPVAEKKRTHPAVLHPPPRREAQKDTTQSATKKLAAPAKAGKEKEK